MAEFVASVQPRMSWVDLPHRRYRLEPGCGVRYDFSITWLAVASDQLPLVVSGVSGQPYVTITIHHNNEPGTYEFMLSAVEDYKRHLDYMYQKMPHATKSDVAMIMAACSVLVSHPNKLGDACEKMLEELG